MTHPFTLDRFQVDAIEALDAGASVLVAAPTGSGKTVVAEHAVARALAAGTKAFYTTPIKALSNQKFGELVARHGADAVGLLTGDNAVNPDAPAVVMTTEVLRNMLYARSSALDGLSAVVLDEVHFLQDAYRGPVWEEVIIHLPPGVQLVCLSATVSNADELAGWLGTVRGETRLVVEHQRPVELENLYLVGDKTTEQLHLLPVLVDGRPNPRAERFDQAPPGRSAGGRPRRRWFTPNRVEVVDLLAGRRMLPAIYFIFSRAACDDAVKASLRAGVRLTSPEERRRITALVEHRVAGLGDDDLRSLGYDRWLESLRAGVAAHHAGMVPPFKEAVEACFAEGLVKVVFATETLALGINMPARSVVIEKLTKFTGEHHEFLTAGQYTQLTGRAGRRGIDDHGNAVVLWSPWSSFADVAGLASSRSFPLTSAFRPTYNMAANLVRRYSPEHAHHLLNLSFAQYQTDIAVVKLEARLARRRADLEQVSAEATCELGDVAEYAAIVAHRTADRRRAANAARVDVDRALRLLAPGSVILVGGRPVAVLSVSERRGGTLRLRVVDHRRRRHQLGPSDFVAPPLVIGVVELPVPFQPDDAGFLGEVGEQLRRFTATPDEPTGGDHDRPADASQAGGAPDGMLDHPVAACPDARAHLKALRRRDRARREVRDLERAIRGRTESLARRFDRVLSLLEAWEYLDGWALTPRGEQLVRVFHECDLLVAEAMASGLLDDLDPASLAGLVSCFTYEHRSAEPPPPPWFPGPKVAHRVERLEQLALDLTAAEAAADLPPTRMPDPAFFALAHAWAAGETFDDVLDEEMVSGGDFVRNIKQLIDLLRQVGDAAGDPTTARTARVAADRLFRGVVAASTAVGTPGAEAEHEAGAPAPTPRGSEPT